MFRYPDKDSKFSEKNNKSQSSPISLDLQLPDPDECVSSTLNDCDENAVCRNEKLSFTCVCKQGFVDRGVLPGRLCVDETEDERALKDRVARVEEDRLKIVVYEKDKEENKEVVDGQFATQGGSIEDLTAMSITALSALGLMFFIIIILFVWSKKKFKRQTFSYEYA